MATIQSLWLRICMLAICFGSINTGNILAQTKAQQSIVQIAINEIGIKEASGKNDGPRIAAYLSYVNMAEGNEWCAAFISWCFGQAGYSQPRNAWSPALFPQKRTIGFDKAQAADIFGIWNNNKKRIAHVGLVEKYAAPYWICIEGNSNNAVERRRRHYKTIYKYANWLD